MENASRALLMAGGVLMAILVISMLMLMFSNLTNVFSEGNQANREAQIVKFNMEYESYNREGVRGTEILSLLAKVHDYNEYQSDYEGTQAGYSPITVKIDSIDLDNIKYSKEDNNSNNSIKTSYTQNKDKNDYQSILDVKTKARNNLKSVGGSRRKEKGGDAELSDSDLETLTASLSLIESTKQLLDSNKTNYLGSELNQIQKTLALMQRIFNPTKPIDADLKDNATPKKNNLKITKSDDEGIKELKNFLDSNYDNIVNNAKQYYQYQQFKKSYFDCTGVTYDTKDTENTKYTGRVKQLNFEYKGTGD